MYTPCEFGREKYYGQGVGGGGVDEQRDRTGNLRKGEEIRY